MTACEPAVRVRMGGRGQFRRFDMGIQANGVNSRFITDIARLIGTKNRQIMLTIPGNIQVDLALFDIAGTLGRWLLTRGSYE